MNVYDAEHITIPQGKVIRILDSNDNVLWWDNLHTPFYIENIGNVSDTISFKKTDYRAVKITIEYSKNGRTWETLGDTDTSGTTHKSLGPGERIYVRAKPIRRWYEDAEYSIGNIITSPNPQSSFRVGGNVMSLVYGSDFTGSETTFRDVYDPGGYTCGWFLRLFKDWTNLVDASRMVLPADHEHNCYQEMFSGCTSLTTPPRIINGTPAKASCSEMFVGCTSLYSVPELPATTLADECYSGMFNKCTSLTTPPKLPATRLSYFCYYLMFGDCTSLITAPELPASTLAAFCYKSMFKGCISLTEAPYLPDAVLAGDCYVEMFYGCSSLKKIKCNATDIRITDCTLYWVKDVAASGTFYKNASMSSWPTGDSGIPSGWTVQDITSYDEYLWLEYAPGTTQIIAANPTDVTQADILASIDEIIVNDTPITVAATTSALSAGDIVRFKFNTRNNVPASAFQGCNVTRILHWPDTGNPVSIGTFSGTPSAVNQPFGRTFEDCNNLISIADAVDGFSNIANNSFWSGSRSGSLMGELTLVPAATEIGKIIIGFAGTSAEHFKFNYNATNIPDTGRDNWYKYYPWNGGGWTYTGTTQYVDMYIGDNVTFIPCYLFMNDINVYIKNSTPPTISSNVGDSCTIHVPSALLSTYQAAWPDLASKMVGDYVV